jgi:glycosyltransferase involved in cell wall biosynthesis
MDNPIRFNEAEKVYARGPACPLVSIGMPTYNGSAKIKSALMSVLNQGYPNLEIIISDNCSTDDTQETCTALAAANASIRYIRQPVNIGVMRNFQFVLRQASGNLFMWMSDDDTLEPGILRKYVEFLMNNGGYSLVSGRIKYWSGNRPLFVERDFNIEHNLGVIRLLKFYLKVVYGSIFYGLMWRDVALRVPLTNRIGDDWHFIAGVSYLGKIKMLDCVGYHKKCGGISRNFKHYAKIMGATSFASAFPHIKIATDAFSNILHGSPIYDSQSYVARMLLALFSFFTLIINYYGRQYPFIVGGKIKRLIGLKTSRARYHAAS